LPEVYFPQPEACMYTVFVPGTGTTAGISGTYKQGEGEARKAAHPPYFPSPTVKREGEAKRLSS